MMKILELKKRGNMSITSFSVAAALLALACICAMYISPADAQVYSYEDKLLNQNPATTSRTSARPSASSDVKEVGGGGDGKDGDGDNDLASVLGVDMESLYRDFMRLQQENPPEETQSEDEYQYELPSSINLNHDY